MLAFAVLGAAAGGLYDVNMLLQRLIPLKALGFLLDLLMMLCCGAAFELVLIAYAGGCLRGYYVLISLTGYLLYMLSLHKIISPVLRSLTYPLTKFYNYLSKKIKKSKKSFKNLLHFRK